MWAKAYRAPGLSLPGRQLKLIQALQATGKPVVMVMINGQPLTINWENKYVPAILEAWFPGPESGKVIAETLFGDNNPGGKLPITFPKTVGQIEFNFPFKPASQAASQARCQTVGVKPVLMVRYILLAMV